MMYAWCVPVLLLRVRVVHVVFVCVYEFCMFVCVCVRVLYVCVCMSFVCLCVCLYVGACPHTQAESHLVMCCTNH